MDEQKLIALAQQGQLESFNQLVLAYQKIVYNTAYRIFGEAPPAEDATQAAFIKAYRNIKQYRGGSFKAWLLRTVTNTCYDELRRQKRRPTTPLEPSNPEDEEDLLSPGWLVDDSPTPEEALEKRELERAIQNCIQSLPEEFRIIIILVDMQEFDYNEAAETIGKPLGTVKSRLARARLRLRDCLDSGLERIPAGERLLNESE